MLSFQTGRVKEIITNNEDITEIYVQMEEKIQKAVNYNKLTGKINIGDKILLNTTAVELDLGTGGVHFVMANFTSNKKQNLKGTGHLMKLRYTPFQIKTLSVEEKNSPYRKQIVNCSSLKRMPVLIGSLHSQLPAAVAGILSVKNVLPAYIMTDGAALPISFSKTVKLMKEKGYLSGTVTVGHAFGGDLEAINIYTGLIAAKEVLKSKIAIILMGPGIVGSGSEFGYTGVEQGEIINSVHILNGEPVAIPRISFADKRKRHYGISHHTITSLQKIALKKAVLPIPIIKDKLKSEYINSQLIKTGILKKHQVIERDASNALKLAEKLEFPLSTMGRGLIEDREFFLAAAASGILAAELL